MQLKSSIIYVDINICVSWIVEQYLIAHSKKALHLYKCNALFFGLLDYNVYLVKYLKCEKLFILGINACIIYFFTYKYIICQTVYKIEL